MQLNYRSSACVSRRSDVRIVVSVFLPYSLVCSCLPKASLWPIKAEIIRRNSFCILQDQHRKQVRVGMAIRKWIQRSFVVQGQLFLVSFCLTKTFAILCYVCFAACLKLLRKLRATRLFVGPLDECRKQQKLKLNNGFPIWTRSTRLMNASGERPTFRWLWIFLCRRRRKQEPNVISDWISDF